MGLPGWYLFLQILFPAAIGVGGGLIAWAQWRTANQKVVLDLFERRFRLYGAVRSLNRAVVGSGKATMAQAQEMVDLWQESRFLFSQEIANTLESGVDALFDLQTAVAEMEDLPAGPERKEHVSDRRAALKTVESVQKALPDLFLPYMLMDTKVIRSPRQWFHVGNARRLAERD